MQSANAVESITWRPCVSASLCVSSGMNVAFGSVAGSAVYTPSTPFLAISTTSA